MKLKKHLYLFFIILLFSCSKKEPEPVKSSAKSILSFTFNSLTPNVKASIDSIQRTIIAVLPIGTNLSNLSPSIIVSNNATVNPASGTIQDFTKPVNYTVTAEDGTTQTYSVNFSIAKSSAKNIKSFVFNNFKPTIPATIDSVKNVISTTLPFGTDLTKLSITIIVSDKASITPNTTSLQDFSNPISYLVTAEDGSILNYTTNIIVAKNSEKKIVSFKFNSLNPPITGLIDSVTRTITAVLPFNSDLTKLIPTIIVSKNATISPNSNQEQDFTKLQNYVVKADDGTTQNYTVSITKLSNLFTCNENASGLKLADSTSLCSDRTEYPPTIEVINNGSKRLTAGWVYSNSDKSSWAYQGIVVNNFNGIGKYPIETNNSFSEAILYFPVYDRYETIDGELNITEFTKEHFSGYLKRKMRAQSKGNVTIILSDFNRIKYTTR